MTSGYWADRVICPFTGCEHSCARNNLLGHFRTQLHRDHFPDLSPASLRPMIDKARRVDGQPNTPRHQPRQPRTDSPRTQPRKPRQPSKSAGAVRKRRERQRVSCPSCGSVQARKNLRRHIESQHVGSYSFDGISRLVRELPEIDAPASSNLPAVIETPRKVRTVKAADHAAEPLNLHALDGGEIALGVVMSQINGHLPVELLPDVVAYVDHTRQLVGQLRAQ